MPHDVLVGHFILLDLIIPVLLLREVLISEDQSEDVGIKVREGKIELNSLGLLHLLCHELVDVISRVLRKFLEDLLGFLVVLPEFEVLDVLLVLLKSLGLLLHHLELGLCLHQPLGLLRLSVSSIGGHRMPPWPGLSKLNVIMFPSLFEDVFLGQRFVLWFYLLLTVEVVLDHVVDPLSNVRPDDIEIFHLQEIEDSPFFGELGFVVLDQSISNVWVGLKIDWDVLVERMWLDEPLELGELGFLLIVHPCVATGLASPWFFASA